VADLITQQELTILDVTQEVANLAEVYYQKLHLPPDAKDDALHLALSAEYQVKYFLTWNLKHFARQERVEEIRRLNAKLKKHQPLIVTPEDLVTQ
jgi:predicted nucleic acid-binding protein